LYSAENMIIQTTSRRFKFSNI